MDQYVDTCTRGKNLLNLLFSSDCNLISNVIPLDNVLISDHTLCVMETNLESGTNKSKYSKKYFYSTDIMKYVMKQSGLLKLVLTDNESKGISKT